ncbi:MAG: TPM domain-containing protein, partial [Leptospiraceae bacterium]|nr:TPM domain-containing protein [Leptospiraceae bacterium]
GLGAAVPPAPDPIRFVNDYAGQLNADETLQLENKLRRYAEQSGNQIVVVIVPELDGRSIEEYSLELAESWGIGQAGRDNGIVLLTAIRERQVRIEVGYGLEGAVPDAIARRVIDGYLLPNFKKGDFFSGYDQATDVLIKLTEGEYGADDLYEVSGYSTDTLIAVRIFIYLFSGFIALIVFLLTRQSRGTLLAVGSITLILYPLWMGWTEYVYFPDRYNIWFWLRLIIGPLMLFFAVFLPTFLYYRVRQLAHRTLKEKLNNDALWDVIKSEYHPDEVQAARKDLLTRFSKLNDGRHRRVLALTAELRQFQRNPGKYFTERSDRKLTQVARQLDKAGTLRNRLYLENKRRQFADRLKQEQAYFKDRCLAPLNKEDTARMSAVIAEMRNWLNDPEKALGIDYDHLRDSVTSFMENEQTWAAYQGTYTRSSIDATRARFESK